MPLDIDQIISDIKNTASGILGKDVATIRGFSNWKITGIATKQL
jgi:hypothetical protein